MWKVLLAGLLLVCAGSALAQDDEDYSDLEAKDPATSIRRLHSMCSSADTSEMLYCSAYITAIVESLTAVGKEPLTHQYGICPVGPISTAATVQAFNNWARRHPKQGSLMRYSGVAWALQERWPCH
jgi:hypothetical protein